MDIDRELAAALLLTERIFGELDATDTLPSSRGIELLRLPAIGPGRVVVSLFACVLFATSGVDEPRAARLGAG